MVHWESKAFHSLDFTYGPITMQSSAYSPT